MSAQIVTLANIQKHKNVLDDNIIHMINSLERLKLAINNNDTDKLYEARFNIDIISRLISRNTGYLARAIESAKKPKKEYPQPEAKSSTVGQAVNPANQGLVDALIEKAESYPADKGYQRNAYITVAEKIVEKNDVIGLRTYKWRPDLFNIDGFGWSVGTSTGKFIIEYFKDKPDRIRVVQS
jgi:hypothetical protein